MGKKCNYCIWQSVGVGKDGEKINYCIGSPDFETPEDYKHLIDQNRIIKYDSANHVYRANNDDDCHLWTELCKLKKEKSK